MKKFALLIVMLFSVLLVAACNAADDAEAEDTETNKETTTYQIGATQIVEHPSLDQAFEGFKQALADQGLAVEYDAQSAQGDQTTALTIAQNFVADDVDLIFANATPSALTALQATNDIPIVFTSVTDAVAAGLVTAMDEPGDNITGVLDMHPDAITETVNFIEEHFTGQTIGLIYNTGEQNSVVQVEAVKEAAASTSLSVVERTVASSAEVQQAATSLVGDADLYYIVTDNTVVSALESVVGVANEQDMPLIVGEPDSLKRGGFATFGIDYYTIGYRSGEMAAEILTGTNTPKEIPVEYPPEISLFVNQAAAEEQGITWKSEWDEALSAE
ncbi:putative ABC transport system substrate-binding protein [Streptohalobacillus salinus]|uniref:Putative ABC transport system substrate-binding protein n=1 Tax=Streptohalobacillus salinus TaxID=621096 RepID=A0A2V3WCM0_9BACI|nr:ABC transporter substrate-binding protein [Streptohalobacillus salinus]PXW90884.1 putative ABC transport system substrate-binding protein [Streptohalobacillus salinus]